MISLTEEEFKSNKFYTTKQCLEYLNLNDNCFIDTVKFFNIKQYCFREDKVLYKLYSISDINNVKESQNKFFQSHTPLVMAKEKLGPTQLAKLKRVDIPCYVRCQGSIFQGYRVCVKNADINNALLSTEMPFNKKKETDNRIILSDYYSLNQVSECLNINKASATRLVSEYNISRIYSNNKVFYSKKEINKLYEEQITIANNYITYDEAISQGYGRRLRERVEKFIVPRHFKSIGSRFENAKVMYLINDLKSEKEATENKVALFENIHSDPNRMFLDRLDVYSKTDNGVDLDKFNRESPFTIGIWLHYVNKTFGNSVSSSSILDRKTREYVYLTKDIYNMVNTENTLKEIYNLSTEEIINFLLKYKTTKRNRILSFLNFAYNKIIVELDKNAIYKKVFNINKINEKFSVKRKGISLSAKVYTAEQFLKVLDYCVNIKEHTEKSIDEIKTKNTVKYASSWLYILIHMNNGWRANDVANFKYVEIQDVLDDIGIYSIDWFENNQLDLTKARIIISRVINKGLMVSKTQVEGNFFCSDDLAPAVATAISILTIFKDSNEISVTSNSRLLCFETKHNNPTQFMINNFFNKLDIKDFEFKSKTMNSTLMTLLYSLKTENKKSDNSLYLAKTLRNHKSIVSTLHYLNLDKGYLDVLSRQLCERGEFGYIYSELANRIYNYGSNSIEETTNQIKLIRNKLGGLFNIELLFGYMNDFEKEKNNILTSISNMEMECVASKMNTLQLKELPSKEFGIQCFLGHLKCNKDVSCKYCAYSIHSIYGLHNICFEFLKLTKEYHSCKYIGEQIKISVKLNHLITLISECAQKYGLEFIYNVLAMTKDEFEETILAIDEPEDIYEDSNLLIN